MFTNLNVQEILVIIKNIFSGDAGDFKLPYFHFFNLLNFSP